MKKISFFALLICCGVAMTKAQDTNYTRTITERSHKIVTALHLSDSSKFFRVRQLVADQYLDLNNIYAKSDKLATALKNSSLTKDSLSVALKYLEQNTVSAVDSLHPMFLSRISRELTGDEVVAIKDGMTYGVLPVTYKGYLAMIPDLTAPQKEQLMKWLIEAREHAMDAPSSEKKHAWFGKYKGRINNYLSAAGYDLKKEGEDWEKRRNAVKSVPGN